MRQSETVIMATGWLRKYHQVAAEESGSTDVTSPPPNKHQSRVPTSLSWDSGYNETTVDSSEPQETFILHHPMMKMPSVIVSDFSDVLTAEFVESSESSSISTSEYSITEQTISSTSSNNTLSNYSRGYYVEQHNDRHHHQQQQQWSWSSSLRSNPQPTTGLLMHLPIHSSQTDDESSSLLSVRRLSDCSSSSSLASQASTLLNFNLILEETEGKF